MAPIAGLGVAYYALARLGLRFTVEESNASPIWPAAAGALAGLLLLGRSAWPGIFLGAFFANAILLSDLGSPATTLWVSAFIACGNTLEALAGWFFCHGWLKNDGENPNHGLWFPEIAASRFAALSLFVGMIGACTGPTAICAAGLQPWSKFPLIWFVWWFGDATGILLVTPFLLVWAQPAQFHWRFSAEATAAFSLLLLTCGMGFLDGGQTYPYLSLAPMAWIATRLGSKAVASGLVLISTWAIWRTTHGNGPFADPSEFTSLLRLAVFLWVSSVTSMALMSTVAIRNRTEAALHKLTAELEERVDVRTAELQKSNEALRESEQRFRQAAEYFPGVFTIYDAEKRFIFVNARASQLAGREEKEMVGHTNEDLFLPEITDRYVPVLNRCVESRAPQTFEATLPLPGGTLIHLYNFIPLLGKNGEIDQILGVAYDITEREARLTAIVETAPDAIISVDSHGLLIGWNNGARRIFGYKKEEVLGKPIELLLPERCREPEASGLERFKSIGESRRLGNHLTDGHALRKDGSEFPIELSISEWKLGEETFITSIIRDITESKAAEEARAQLAAIVESSEDAILSKTLDSLITSWNRGAERLYGYAAAEIVGKPVSVLCPPECKPELSWIMERARRGERIEHYDTKRVCKDGRLVDVSLSVSPIYDKVGGIIGCSAIARDITARKRAERALRERERRERERAAELAALLEAVPTPIFIAHDPDCLYMTGNSAAAALLRIPAGGEISLIASEKTRPRNFRAIKDGRELTMEELPAQRAARGFPVQNFEFSLVFEDGTTRHVLGYGTPLFDDAGRPRGAVHVLVDITERIVAVQKLKEALEKEVVLRREIHHRVKNNLQVIISLLYLQSTRVTDPRTLEILRESEMRTRAIAITYELLSQSQNLTKIEFADYVRKLTTQLFDAYKISSSTVAVIIDAEEISLSLDTALPCGLLITELVSNAFKHAFPSGRGGSITISLKPTKAGLVQLIVHDNGVGLPQGFDVANIPGVGLKLVRDLTQQLGGTVELQSDHGTVATITFANPDPPELI
ncbi:MAG: hypothetical protein JWL90_2602 [Chthoniobacteraceae bacterium]|nr:hypothetical protein [Chthoniobacteraceae bacterium]